MIDIMPKKIILQLEVLPERYAISPLASRCRVGRATLISGDIQDVVFINRKDILMDIASGNSMFDGLGKILPRVTFNSISLTASKIIDIQPSSHAVPDDLQEQVRSIKCERWSETKKFGIICNDGLTCRAEIHDNDYYYFVKLPHNRDSSDIAEITSKIDYLTTCQPVSPALCIYI